MTNKRNKVISDIHFAHVYENKNYPSGKIVICNVLAYPLITDIEFNKINPKKYKWENREFKYPLFNNFKINECFLFRVYVDKKQGIIDLYKDEQWLNRGKKAKLEWDNWMTEQWDKLGKDWNMNEKLEGNIEL